MINSSGANGDLHKMELKNRVALITGAARGIGRAIALRFVREGAAVAITDIRGETLKEVAEEIKGKGGQAVFQETDVTISEQVNDLVSLVEEKLGEIDILVNNAAVSKILPFLQTTEEIWDKTLRVNLKGTFLCCRAVIPGMIKKGRGKIINMSSQSGKRGSTWHAAYCASKFAVIGLSQSLALEFAPHKINVNALCPGVVDTPLWEEAAADYAGKRGIKKSQWREDLIRGIPLGRLGSTEDVADLAVFLASHRSDYITGQAINLSGGSVLH